ncbi:MAG: proprotein convertase P-domain-containing protein [Myxococcota bacterium]
MPSPTILAMSMMMHEVHHTEAIAAAAEAVDCATPAAVEGCDDQDFMPTVFVNADGMPLPDTSRPAVSVLTIEEMPMNVREVMISVDIRHTARGDMEVNLYTPDGSRYRLKGHNEADRIDDLNTWWIIDGTYEQIVGDWRLEIIDHYYQNEGHLSEWRLEFSATPFDDR